LLFVRGLYGDGQLADEFARRLGRRLGDLCGDLRRRLALGGSLGRDLEFGRRLLADLGNRLARRLLRVAFRLAECEAFFAAGLALDVLWVPDLADGLPFGLAVFFAAGLARRGLDLGCTFDFAGVLRVGLAGFLTMVILD
jgi:hypothetical protein